MHPELQQDVIGFEGGIGGEQRAPVAVGMLQREKVVGGALDLLLGGGKSSVVG